VESPRVARSAGKYQGKGMCGTRRTLEELRIPKEAKKRLVEIGNHGLARATWSNYRTAETMLWRCQKETGSCMELPMDTGKILIFVDWLITVRGGEAQDDRELPGGAAADACGERNGDPGA
jgi:hypothetical protein